MPKVRNPEHMAALGRRLRARREWLGLTLEQVSRETSVSWQQIGKYERGVDDPSTSTLIRLAAALDTHPGYLLADPSAVADEPFEQAAEFLALPGIAPIVRRLQSMSDDERKRAHAVLCAIVSTP